MAYRIQDTIGFNLFVAHIRLKAGLARAMRPFDITPEQFAILSLLREQDGLQQREIADLLVKDRPNITRILERLEKKRLIRRKTDTQDRRAVRVHITKTGLKICPKLEQIAIEYRNQAYQGLNQSEQQQLRDMLHLISENLV